MAKPIFVIGNNRSGTKWLSNLLLNHSQVTGVTSEYHFGVLETDLLTVMPELFGSLDNLDNRVGMMECFAATDFFRRTGLNKEDLYRIQPQDYYDFFGQLMDRLAQSKKSDHWIQKFSPLSLPGLIRHFPEGRYVFIVRGVLETIRSNLKLSAAVHPKRNAWKYLFWYYYGLRQMRVFRDLPGVLMIRYEDLKTHTESTMRTVCDHLNLNYEPGMLASRYSPNSSFASAAGRKRLLSGSDNVWIRLGSMFFRMMPLGIFQLIHGFRSRFKTRQRPFVRQTFSEIVRQAGLAQPGNDYFWKAD